MLDRKPKRNNGKRGNSTVCVKNLKQLKRALHDCLLDKRTAIARELARWRDDVVTGLGGADACSMQDLVIADMLSRELMLLDLIDGFIFGRGLYVDKRKRRLHAAVLDRQKLADSIARHMALLGVEKRTPTRRLPL